MLRNMIAYFLLLLALFPVSAVCGDSGNETWQERGNKLASKLQLTIKAEKNEVMAGQPIMLSVSLKNISNDELIIECSRNMYSEYTFKVVDAQNKEVKLTSYLLQFKKDQLTSSDNLIGYHLKAGQSADCSLNACALYDMTLPGKYFITLRRGFPLPSCIEDQMSAISNTVEVNVVYPAASYIIKEAE